ncbi:pilus assembly protein PilX [Diaphorobacter sp.]|uniref:pilus assembly PilX family protein n=1 Tax=Diaphorobacter sp. TaxID=1934310 RepID=UPI0028ABAA7E|nr:pilus assembly protein PilX [Diaphorobacter sp.]
MKNKNTSLRGSATRTAKAAGQRGAALLVSMIMVLLVLLLAVVAMRSITLESRITANMLANQVSYEVADGSLREGERLILHHGVPLAQCAAGSAPVNGSIPCYVSQAQGDTLKLNTDFSQSTKAADFTQRAGYWYPRYIGTTCPPGKSATAALEKATTGCTEFYEVNSQATEKNVKDCGPDALCLRSSINMFVR